MDETQKKPPEKGNIPEAKRTKEPVKILFFYYRRVNGKSQRESLAKKGE